MRLLVGLGNPGADRARNRHNIGFMAVDEIVRRHSFSPWRSRFQGHVAEGVVGGQRVLALKPMTFMNESGRSVQAAANFLKIALEDTIVFHDELDLFPGKMRVKQGGGAAGHNGLRSIDAHFGNATWRVRLGIGHPGNRDMVLHWVLGDFAKADMVWLEPLMAAVSSELPLMLAGDANAYMSRVAQLSAPVGAPPGKPITGAN